MLNTVRVIENALNLPVEYVELLVIVLPYYLGFLSRIVGWQQKKWRFGSHRTAGPFPELFTLRSFFEPIIPIRTNQTQVVLLIVLFLSKAARR